MPRTVNFNINSDESEDICWIFILFWPHWSFYIAILKHADEKKLVACGMHWHDCMSVCHWKPGKKMICYVCTLAIRCSMFQFNEICANHLRLFYYFHYYYHLEDKLYFGYCVRCVCVCVIWDDDINVRTCGGYVCVYSLPAVFHFFLLFKSSHFLKINFNWMCFKIANIFLFNQINKPASPKHAPVSPASTLDKRVQQPKQPVKVQGKRLSTTAPMAFDLV